MRKPHPSQSPDTRREGLDRDRTGGQTRTPSPRRRRSESRNASSLCGTRWRKATGVPRRVSSNHQGSRRSGTLGHLREVSPIAYCRRGQKSATCLDVGHGQLHYKLRQDKRVTNIERTNLRNIQPGDLPTDQYPIIVMDLSFISLRKVIVAAWAFLSEGGHLIALAKPQFEATKEEADRGKGVIRDEEVRARTLEEVKTFVAKNLPDAQLFAETESPLRGAEGNVEYFLGWENNRK